MTYTLNSPFVDLTWERRPPYFRVILTVWMVFWFVVCTELVYLYAVVFASWVGFETAVLVGIGMLVIAGGGDS